MFGETLTEAALQEIVDRCSATVMLVASLPEAEQVRPAPGKNSAPEDVGFVQAIFASLAQRELDRRKAVQAGADGV